MLSRRGLMLSTAAGAAAAGLRGQSSRRAPDETLRTDVCVIGSGSGGTGAALAAARGGADTVLVEFESILGGTSTNAWVNSWEPVSGADGLPREIYAAMRQDPLGVTYADYSRGAHRVVFKDGKWQRGGHHGLPWEPRAFNYFVRELLEATGRCRVLLNTIFYRAHRRGDMIEAVEAWFCGRRLRIEARIFIDSTADAELCVDAGCDFHLGEDPRSRYQEPTAPESAELQLNGLTLCYRIKDTGVTQKPWLPKEIPEGICRRPVHTVVLPNGDHLLNAVGMIDGNAVMEMEYSELMREAYRRVLEHFFWLQQLPPGDRWNRWAPKGYGTWAIAGVAPRIGVRESRRVLGDYVLTENDVRAGVQSQTHPDIIAISDHAVDVHGRKVRLYEVPNGPYGIPYRCLLPRGVRNLFIASRAASFSHIAAASCRLCRTMMTLGQAAGNAAALCVRERVPPREVDVARLRATLVEQGVAVTAA